MCLIIDLKQNIQKIVTTIKRFLYVSEKVREREMIKIITCT